MFNKISFIDQNVFRIIINWAHKIFFFPFVVVVFVFLLIFFADHSVAKLHPNFRLDRMNSAENIIFSFLRLHYWNIFKSLCHLNSFKIKKEFQKLFSSIGWL